MTFTAGFKSRGVEVQSTLQIKSNFTETVSISVKIYSKLQK